MQPKLIAVRRRLKFSFRKGFSRYISISGIGIWELSWDPAETYETAKSDNDIPSICLSPIADSALNPGLGSKYCAEVFLGGDQEWTIVGSFDGFFGPPTMLIYGAPGKTNCLIPLNSWVRTGWSSELRAVDNRVVISGVGQVWVSPDLALLGIAISIFWKRHFDLS